MTAVGSNSDARKRRQESVPADETVRVPAALVEDLRRAMRYVDVKDSLLAREDQEDAFKCARALVDAAEGEVPKRVCGDVGYGWSGEEIIEADAPRRPCVSEHGDAAKCRKCYPAPAAPVGEPLCECGHQPQSHDADSWCTRCPCREFTPAPLSSPRRTRDEAQGVLLDAAEDVDLSAYYDPSPSGRVSLSCREAERRVELWLRDRAARLAGEDEPIEIPCASCNDDPNIDCPVGCGRA